MTRKQLPRPSKSNTQIRAYELAARQGLKAQHVVASKEGGWAVKRAGAQKASRTFSTQNEAIKYAGSVAKNTKSEVFIHRRDGQIRDRSSFGNDPHPSRG